MVFVADRQFVGIV